MCYKCVNIHKFTIEKCGYLMENSKKNFILKIGLIKVITIILRILWISSVIIIFYPQYMCKSIVKAVDKKIDISEDFRKKELEYFKEDVRIPIFIDGKDETKIRNINDIVYKDIISRLKEAENAASENFKDTNAKPLFPFEVKSDFVITEENDNIISLYNDYYEFLGGAHGSTIRTGYTVDRNTEELLNLKDMFVEEYNYKDIVNSKIKDEIRKAPDKYFYTADNFQGISDSQNFYIKDGKLIIFYEQYDIAPYVAGIPEFEVSIKEFGENYKY